jgi:hypothetical protein
MSATDWGAVRAVVEQLRSPQVRLRRKDALSRRVVKPGFESLLRKTPPSEMVEPRGLSPACAGALQSRLRRKDALSRRVVKPRFESLLRKTPPSEMVEPRGFEPLTSSMPLRRSTS